MAGNRAAAATLTLALYLVAGMTALAAVRRVHRTTGVAVASAQVDMLRELSQSGRVLAVNVDRRAAVVRDNIPGRMRIEIARPLSSRASSRDDRPLFAIPDLPAGDYRLSVVATELRGWVMIGAGRDQFALRTEPLSVAAAGVEIRAAVNLRELVIRGDEDARQVVRTLRVEPLGLVPERLRPTHASARLAVRYSDTTVFFLDDDSFPEPEAFWLAGAGRSTIVVQPDHRAVALDVLVRNAPVDNHVTLEAGAWKEEWTLGPGEERRVRVPLDPTRDATLVHLSSSAGFRPSAEDAKSRDDRYLGVWVKIE